MLRHSGKKAAKDAHEREQAIERRTKRLAAGIKGKGRSGRCNQDALSLDEAAIARDKVFDGLHGVCLSAEHLPARPVYRHYRELWRIKEGFRVMKHTMAIRPIFRWTEHRVRAPIAICFVAFGTSTTACAGRRSPSAKRGCSASRADLRHLRPGHG